MEVDLTKPLLPKFRLKRKIQKVEYELVHTVCFKCGKYGHHQKACGVGTEKKDDPVMQQPAEKVDLDELIAPNFGSWMIVKRQNRKRDMRHENESHFLKNQHFLRGGTRFDALRSSSEGELEAAMKANNSSPKMADAFIDKSNKKTTHNQGGNSDAFIVKGNKKATLNKDKGEMSQARLTPKTNNGNSGNVSNFPKSINLTVQGSKENSGSSKAEASGGSGTFKVASNGKVNNDEVGSRNHFLIFLIIP